MLGLPLTQFLGPLGQILPTVVVVAAVIALIGRRQLRWRALDAARPWRSALILGGIGAGLVVVTGQLGAMTLAACALLAVELLVGAASGVVMGRLTTLRPHAAAAGKNPETAPRWEARGGAAGLLVFVGLLLVRVAIGVAAHVAGIEFAVSSGTILLLVAANRAGAAAVLGSRTAALEEAPRAPHRAR